LLEKFVSPGIFPNRSKCFSLLRAFIAFPRAKKAGFIAVLEEVDFGWDDCGEFWVVEDLFKLWKKWCCICWVVFRIWVVVFEEMWRWGWFGFAICGW
jgi:hypothetical protein